MEHVLVNWGVQKVVFYHGWGVDGEWMGFEISGLGFYPDRIRAIRG
jgi:hypothetical protein